MAPENMLLDPRPFSDSDTTPKEITTNIFPGLLLVHYDVGAESSALAVPYSCTELVDSKNRKNMDTARSDTTLTDRSGCLDRTFEASSCTQMERDIRWAILRSNVTNSINPDGGSVLAFPSFAPFPSLTEDSLDPSFTLPRAAGPKTASGTGTASACALSVLAT